jgi:hypothetical protein
MKQSEDKPRNFVKKYADEFTKPSRFRDRKNDYERSHKHRGRAAEDSEVPHSRARRESEEYLQESADWRDHLDTDWGDSDWVQPAEDPPTTG